MSSVLSLWRHQLSHCDVISPLCVRIFVSVLDLCFFIQKCSKFLFIISLSFAESHVLFQLKLNTHTSSESAMIFQVLNPQVCTTHLTKKKKCPSSVTPGLTWKVSHTCQYWTIIEQGKTELLIDTISLKITYLKFIWRTALYDLPYWKAEGGD